MPRHDVWTVSAQLFVAVVRLVFPSLSFSDTISNATMYIQIIIISQSYIRSAARQNIGELVVERYVTILSPEATEWRVGT